LSDLMLPTLSILPMVPHMSAHPLKLS